MQEETPSILRRNIKYKGLIQSAILICFMVLLGMGAKKITIEEDVTKNLDLTAGVSKSIWEKNKEFLPVTLSAGVTKTLMQSSQNLQVERLTIDTVAAAIDTTEIADIEETVETVETVQLSSVSESEAVNEIQTVAEAEAEAETETESESESEPVVQYKSLEEVEMSRDMDLTKTSGLSREDFCNLLADFKYDYAGFYERNSGLIWDLSQEYQVNEFFICGVFAEESLYGSNEAHISTHNYGSIMKNGKLVSYESDAEGIRANFELFANSYLSPDGKYYKGVTIDSIADTYCNSSWAGRVYSCMKKFL